MPWSREWLGQGRQQWLGVRCRELQFSFVLILFCFHLLSQSQRESSLEAGEGRFHVQRCIAQDPHAQLGSRLQRRF